MNGIAIYSRPLRKITSARNRVWFRLRNILDVLVIWALDLDDWHGRGSRTSGTARCRFR